MQYNQIQKQKWEKLKKIQIMQLVGYYKKIKHK